MGGKSPFGWAAEEDQLVAFLKTLTDGYTPAAAKH
jgi:hypothetical protein